jgi:prepilin-type N-terminal cleavage/methylation domain-containing protein
MTRDRGERGFTLIELLVSLAIFGFVAVLLLQGLGASWRLADIIERRGAADQEVTTAQMLLRSRIERLRGVLRLDTSFATVELEGTDQGFSFQSAPMARSAPDALQRYRLLLSPDGDLTLYSVTSLDDRIDATDRRLIGWTPTRLLSNVRTIAISYYGADPFQAGARWQAQWRDRPQLPELVRIDVAFAPGDRRSWPSLIIRPRVSAATNCQVDPMTGRCGRRM